MLHAYDILDTVPEEGFEDLVQLAAMACATPVALVSLVAADRQWFKARVGFPPCETDLDRSVCKFALVEPDLIVIPDLSEDPRTSANPLVTGEPHIRFYAGAPLRSPEGAVLGSMCVIDTLPRPEGLSPAQGEHLRRCARQVMGLMELRRAVSERDGLLARQDAELRRERRLAVLVEASAALLTAEEPSRVIRTVLAANAASLGFEQCLIHDLSADGRRLRLAESIGAGRAMREALADVGLDGPLCGLVARTGEPVMVPRVQAGPHPPLETVSALKVGTYAGFPIFSADRLVGVLSFCAATPEAFDPDALTFFAAVARYLSAVHGRLDGAAALRASDARSRLAQEAGRVGTFEVDVATGMMTVSPEFCRLFGLPVSASYPADAATALILPEDAHLASTEASRRAGSGPLEVTYRVRRADDGAVRWITRNARFVRDDRGRSVASVGTVQDITDTQRILHLLRDKQAQLEATDERLQMALTASGVVGLWDWMVDTDLLHGDGNFARLYGLDPDRTAAGLTMEDYQEFVVPEDLEPLRARIRATFEHGADFLVEYRLAVPGRPLRWVECKGRLIHDDQGRAVRFSGTAVDVTARKSSEAEARRLAAIVEQSGDFIGVAHLDGTVAWVNDAGRRLVGLTDAASARSTTVQDYFEADRWPEIAATVFPAVQRDGHWRGELHFRHFVTGALIPVIYDVISLRDASGAVSAFATVTRDITEQKRAEERQEVLNHELAHRLKNTLSIVSSIASQTLRVVPERAPVEAFERRLQALATAHDALLSRNWTSAPLHAVSEVVLGNIARSERITLRGPDIELGPRATMSVSLLLHELATNAAKYGALSTDAGHVELSWSVETEGTSPDPDLMLRWRERGGPPVVAPTTRGFGSRLIRMGLVGTGGVELSYSAAGFEASMQAPLSEVQRV